MSRVHVAQAGERMRAGYFNRDAFKQRKRLVLVLKTGISGMRYYVDLDTDAGRATRAKLVPGTPLALFRETDNEYDVFAVAVYTTDGEKIGHMTRHKNETIARLMDMGKRFVAIVDDAPAKPPDPRGRAPTEDYALPFSVYMEE